MSKKFWLISPRIAVQKGDFLGSGVPYWPIEMATVASWLKDKGLSVSVLDLFGLNPKKFEERTDHFLQGVRLADALCLSDVSESDIFFVYCLSYMSFAETLENVQYLRSSFPKNKIFALENSQAVTAYAIDAVRNKFFESGVDGLLLGEIYSNWDSVQSFVCGDMADSAGIPNLIPKSDPGRKGMRLYDLVKYPVPAWELFNVKGYWSLPYSHGPKTKTFFPLLTSRGCPYPCDFCVVPEMNSRKWRGRPPDEVVNEIMTLRDLYGVYDFQIEDLNPTIQSSRWREISRILIEKNANIRFYLVSGTKAETVPVSDVPLLAQAGCRYISISPESGSASVMKAVGKPFNYEHGLKLIEACRASGISTQACFIVGHPSEQESDHIQSCEYLKKLLAAGLDEAAIFIVSPFAGSQIHKDRRISLDDKNNLISFSPKGREEYASLTRRRGELISTFFKHKLKKGPDLWLQGLRSIFGTPKTKMENVPRRLFFLAIYTAFAKVKRLIANSHSSGA